MTSAPGVPCEADDPDLLELLDARQLSHWLHPLLVLCQRHQGWLADYEFDESLEPDFRPLSDVLSAVRHLPSSPAPSNRDLVDALCTTDFMFRQAVDCRDGHIPWDPLVEPYREFKRRYADCYPYWAGLAAGIHDRLLNWGRNNATSPSPPADPITRGG